MHEIEWRDWVRQYLGGSDCGVPKLAPRKRGEAARRSAVGGGGNKPIGVVPKAEVGRLSVSPRCARRGSEAGSFEGIPDGDAYMLPASEAQARPHDRAYGWRARRATSPLRTINSCLPTRTLKDGQLLGAFHQMLPCVVVIT
jgi:hypothetical protein